MKLPDVILEKEGHRENGYRFLSACFCLPTPEVFDSGLLENLMASLERVCSEALGFAKEMKAALSQYTETALLVDYSKLFLGPFKPLAPPYGSVYLDPDRKLMGDSTADVVRWYQRVGVSFDRSQKDLPDHIAVELEFMSYLIWKGREACQNSNLEAFLKGLEDQQLFLERHLGAWVPPFAWAIKKGTDNLFYQSLADCTTAFIESDLRYLRDIREKLAHNAREVG